MLFDVRPLFGILGYLFFKEILFFCLTLLYNKTIEKCYDTVIFSDTEHSEQGLVDPVLIEFLHPAMS